MFVVSCKDTDKSKIERAGNEDILGGELVIRHLQFSMK